MSRNTHTISPAAILAIVKANDRRYDQRFLDQEKALHAAMQSAETAITKADAAHEKRLDSINEFRAQLNDQFDTLMPKAEAVQRLSTLETDVKQLATTVNTYQSAAAGRDAFRPYIIPAIQATVSVITILYVLLHH